MSDTEQNRKDLEAARKIVRNNGPYVGSAGSMEGNIAVAVALGIAHGRKDGLELAAKLIADKLREPE